jgi:hypothetical protein
MLNLKPRVTSDRTVRQGQIGQVTCSNCRIVMHRISLKTNHSDGLNEAVYRCPQCKTETMRWIKL